MQTTLAKATSLRGLGVHTGTAVECVFQPAPPGHGVVFYHSGCAVKIPAKVDYVVSTQQATVLADQGARISTVEHVLSALMAVGVDNVLISITGDELPICDGSAWPIVTQLRETGIVEQAATRSTTYRVTQPVELSMGDARLQLWPAEHTIVEYQCDFDHPSFSQSQHCARVNLTEEGYPEYLAQARTFGFLADYEAARARQCALGASLENTLVFDDRGIMNPGGLRHPAECALHKVLDIIGDFALLGGTLLGEIKGYRCGHQLNIAMVRQLVQTPGLLELLD